MSRAFISPYRQHVSDDIDLAAIEICPGDCLRTRLLDRRLKAAFGAHIASWKLVLEIG
jgi:hypothetical protein